MTGKGATVVLIGANTRQTACKLVYSAPDNWLVTVREPTRTLEQSSRFYALCSSLARSALTWDGERRTKRSWHDLLIHAHMIATGKNPRLVAGLNGGRVSLLMSTKDMTKSEMSSLIDFSIAWAVEHGIEV